MVRKYKCTKVRKDDLSSHLSSHLSSYGKMKEEVLRCESTRVLKRKRTKVRKYECTKVLWYEYF